MRVATVHAGSSLCKAKVDYKLQRCALPSRSDAHRVVPVRDPAQVSSHHRRSVSPTCPREHGETDPGGNLRRGSGYRHARSAMPHETGEVSAGQERKIPQGRGRAPCLCKPILDFHVTRLPLKGLDV